MTNDELKDIQRKLFAKRIGPDIVQPVREEIVDGAHVIYDASGRWLGTFGPESWKAMQEYYNKDSSSE